MFKKYLLILGIITNALCVYADFSLLKKTDTAALFKLGDIMIELRNHQDILDTKLPVSAIVNAANEDCLGGGGIDGAISKAGGKALHYAREQLPIVNGVRCPTGQARLTISGDIMNAPFVIHAVGPQCASKASLQAVESTALINAYVNTLDLINDWNRGTTTKHPEFNTIHFMGKRHIPITSVAFPAISAGIYNCNIELAAPLVASAVLDYLQHIPEPTYIMCILCFIIHKIRQMQLMDLMRIIKHF